MSFYTSWLIGATNFGSAQDYTIGGNPYSVAAGDYYLRDATGSRSLLQQIEDDMDTEGLTNASVFIDQSGYVRITSDDSFAIVWTDTDLRDALGFTGNITSTTSAVAGSHSPLWWSPSWKETTQKTPIGAESRPVYGRSVTSSPTGSTVKVTIHHTAQWQEFLWKQVPIDRIWVPPGSNGEYRTFYDTVLATGYRFKLYPDVQENPGSSVAVVWTTADGPYKVREHDDDWYNRSSIGSADVITDIEIKAVVVSEIS